MGKALDRALILDKSNIFTLKNVFNHNITEMTNASASIRGTQSLMLINAKDNAFLTGNSYFEGGAWQRYDTTKNSIIIQTNVNHGQPQVGIAPPGTGNISFTYHDIMHAGNLFGRSNIWTTGQYFSGGSQPIVMRRQDNSPAYMQWTNPAGNSELAYIGYIDSGSDFHIFNHIGNVRINKPLIAGGSWGFTIGDVSNNARIYYNNSNSAFALLNTSNGWATVSAGVINGLTLNITNSNDGIISIEDTGASSSTFRLKRIISSKNVNGGNGWLFRSLRPSDAAMIDYLMYGGVANSHSYMWHDHSYLYRTVAFATGGAQTLTADTWTKVLYGNEWVDHMGCYNHSTSVFTAPRQGLYQITASVGVVVPSGGIHVNMAVVVNNSGYYYIGSNFSTTNGRFMQIGGSFCIPLNASETLEVRVSSSVGITFVNDSGAVHMSVAQIG